MFLVVKQVIQLREQTAKPAQTPFVPQNLIPSKLTIAYKLSYDESSPYK